MITGPSLYMVFAFSTESAQEEEVIDGMCCLLSTIDELVFVNYIRKLTCASKVVELPCVIDAI